MAVLFTFFAQRYERRSVIITSNVHFKAWDRIFKDPMTTAAAVDRVVHPPVILEMTGPSVREIEAKTRGTPTTTTPTTNQPVTTTTSKKQSGHELDGEV
jgi:hypothetical protein